MADRYWNPAAGANFNSATAWATSDGGTPNASAPIAGDNAIFSNTNSQTCTATAVIACADLNFNYGTGFAGTFTGGTQTAAISGNLTLSASMTITGTGIWTLTGTGKTLSTNTKTLTNPITISTGQITLGSHFNSSSSITMNNAAGTLNASNYNVTATAFLSNTGSTQTVTMGSGTWTLTGTGNVWWAGTSMNVNADTSTIKLTNNSSTAITFFGNGKTYNNLWITGARTGNVTIKGNNVFNELKDDGSAAHNLLFAPSITGVPTNTITTWNVNGTAGNLITINSSLSSIYSSAGTYTWVCPPGVTSVLVECYGGGGAGGSQVAAGVSGGGAGGQYAAKTISVTPGNSYTAVVGGGGGPVAGADGNPGVDSTFDTTTVIAKGGAGGKTSANGGTGGAGSTTGGVGDTVYRGGNGSNAVSGAGGGGGGGAGSTGNGGDTTTGAAGTGTTVGGGNGGTGGVTNQAGNPGFTYGGAGGGAIKTVSANKAGGAGAGGAVKITPAYHIFSKSSGTATSNYVNITNSVATGGATWNAYTSNGCVDGGNNIGWNFTAPAAPAQAGFLYLMV